MSGRAGAALVAVACFLYAGWGLAQGSHGVCVEGSGHMTRDGWDGDCYRYERVPGPDVGIIVVVGFTGTVFLVAAVRPDAQA